MRFFNDRRVAFLMYLAAVGLMLIFPSWASAHESKIHESASFVSGLSHPLSGVDHVLMLLTAGYCSKLFGKRAWHLSLIVLASLFVGYLAGLYELGFKPAEVMIVFTMFCIGALLLIQNRAPYFLTLFLFVISGLVHGFVHGKEVPVAQSSAEFGLGFLIASTLLLWAGTLIATQLHERKWMRHGVVLTYLSASVFTLLSMPA